MLPGFIGTVSRALVGKGKGGRLRGEWRIKNEELRIKREEARRV